MAPIRQTTAWLWGGAIVLIVAAYGPGLDLPGRALREALPAPCALLLLGVAIVTPRVRPSLWLPALLGVALLSGVSGVLLSPAPETMSVARDLIVLAAPWIACLAAALHGPSGIDEAIERAAVVSLAGIAGVGLVQAWTGWQGIAQIGPPAATFVNRNVAAQAVVPLLPLVAVVLIQPGKSRWRWPALAAEAAGLTFLIATRARGSWIAIACGAAVAAVVLLRWRDPSQTERPAFLRFGVALLLAALAAWVPISTDRGSMPSVGSTLATLSQPTSGSGGVRLALWSNAVVMTGSRTWLGQGAGRFPVVYPRYQAVRRATPDFGTEYQPSHPHNDWLEYAVELGWPATVCLAATVLIALILCMRRRARGTSTEHRLRGAGRAAVIGAVLAHGLLSFPMHAPASAFLVWTVVGRAWAATGRVSASRPSALSPKFITHFAGTRRRWLRELRTPGTSTPLRKSVGDCAGPRRRWLRCFSLKYREYDCVKAPCQPRRWLRAIPNGLPQRGTSVRPVLAAAVFILAAATLVLGVTELRTRAALGRATRSLEAGDCAQALRQASEVTRSSSGLRHAQGAAAMIVFECESDAEASLAVLEPALAAHPNHLNLLLAVGSRRMKAGRLEEAERAYRAAVDIVPDQARPWTGLAMTQAMRGDRGAAGESCRNALRLEADLAAARAFCEANELVP